MVTREGAPEPGELLGSVADERLLTADPSQVPAVLGHPLPIPRRASRDGIVGVGVTLTAVTLIGGTILAIAGAAELLLGDGGTLAVVALVLGLMLASTHWGWAHVAELTGQRLEQRRNAAVLVQRRAWLRAIAPFSHYEITTTAADDGTIAIERVCYQPVRANEGTFDFQRVVESTEIHSGDEPAAVISERAELLRRQAAADTARERERFQLAADRLQSAALAASDDAERRQAQAAASRALSEQINANLRDPPLVE